MMAQVRGLHIVEIGLGILCNKTNTAIVETRKRRQRSFLHRQRISLPVRERETETHLPWRAAILIDGQMIPIGGIKASRQRRRLLSLKSLPMLIGDSHQFATSRINEDGHK